MGSQRARQDRATELNKKEETEAFFSFFSGGQFHSILMKDSVKEFSHLTLMI